MQIIISIKCVISNFGNTFRNDNTSHIIIRPKAVSSNLRDWLSGNNGWNYKICITTLIICNSYISIIYRIHIISFYTFYVNRTSCRSRFFLAFIFTNTCCGYNSRSFFHCRNQTIFVHRSYGRIICRPTKFFVCRVTWIRI